MDNEIEELQAILREDPYNCQARRTLSLALLDNGFNKEAKKNLLYLVRTFPENAELHYNLGIACEKLFEYEPYSHHRLKRAHFAYKACGRSAGLCDVLFLQIKHP